MIKCQNCGTENDESTVFCENCGTKIPHEKECPGCHAKMKLAAKFCSKCGYNFGAQQNPSAADKGMAIGDKNVIAGDVIGKQETFKIAGAATIVKNEDETKKMLQCHVCGHNILILKSIKCPVCQNITCEDCFDSANNMCVSCQEQKKSDKENVYTQALRKALEDHKITLEERRELMALQKELGISQARAFELENLIRSGAVAEKNTSSLSQYVRLSLDKALNCLYDDGNTQQAYDLLTPIYKRYPQNEEVLTSFLYATIQVNPDEALKIIQQNLADVIGIHLVCIDYDLKKHDLNSADERLNTALILWPDSLLLACRRVLCLKAMYDELQDPSLLQLAMETLSAIGKPQNKLEASWLNKAQCTICLAMGDEIPKLDKEYCKEHNLYFSLSQPDFPEQGKTEADSGTEILQPQNPQEDDPELSEKPGDNYKKIHSVSDDESLPERRGTVSENALVLFAQASACKDSDAKEYIRLLTLAAEKGCSDAQNELGNLYSAGMMIPQDLNVAVKWYRKAAEQGNPNAQTELAAYLFNYGTTDSIQEGMRYLTAATEQNFADAQYLMGLVYKRGIGVDENPFTAWEWFKKAAEQGHAEAKKEMDGDEKKEDDVSANDLFAQASACKDSDEKEYIRLLTLAAEKGCSDAQNELGDLYSAGMMIPQDLNVAVKWYRKAAEQGNPNAQTELAACLLNIGSDESIQEGVKFLHEAVAQNFAEAQYLMGLLYKRGIGVDENPFTAWEWFKKAAAQGHEEARNEIEGNAPNEGKNKSIERKNISNTEENTQDSLPISGPATLKIERYGSNSVGAIKVLRQYANLGLLEAKNAVDKRMRYQFEFESYVDAQKALKDFQDVGVLASISSTENSSAPSSAVFIKQTKPIHLSPSQGFKKKGWKLW